MARSAQTQYQPKDTWFADISDVIERRASANWFMRTDSGKHINIDINKGELVHLQCGFRDIRGTMAVLSRCERIASKRGAGSHGGGKVLMPRAEVQAWLERARAGEEIEDRPSERLAFGAGKSEAAPPKQAARPAGARPAPPAATAAKPAPAAAPARETRARDKPIPWVRRTVIVSAGVGSLALVSASLLGVEIPGPGALWSGLWSHTASEQIRSDTTWSGRVRIEGRVNVEGEAVLTLAAGTRVEAAPGAEITIGRDARLIALGTRDEPIVLTARDSGGERRSGDWAGIRALGNAPVDASAETLRSERVAQGHDGYGGGDVHDACARLRFVRIEFAGGPDGAALALRGCGARAWLEYVQIHRHEGSGIALSGGEAHLRNIVVSQGAGTGIETGRGWKGTWQNVVVQMHAQRGGVPVRIGSSDERAQAGEGPTLWNTTVVGTRSDEASPAITLGGTQPVQIRNTLVAGVGGPVLRVDGAPATALLRQGATQVRRVAVSGGAEPSGEGESARAVRAWAREADNGVVRTSVQMLGPEAWYASEPDFTPRDEGAASQGDAPTEGFSAGAFCGAVRPGAQASWMWGWTEYPRR